MPFAGKADIVFFKAPSTAPTIVVGTSTHDGVNIQDLYDAVREYEDNLDNIDIMVPENGIAVGSGKEGIGGGNLKPPTITINAPWTVTASTRATAIPVFTFDGGTLLSDTEAAGSTAPVSPFTGASGVLTFDRAKGQEGLLLNVTDLLRLRQWMTNAQWVSEGSTANFRMWDDGADPLVDPPLEVQDITDKDGNPITLPPGAPARRSEAQ